MGIPVYFKSILQTYPDVIEMIPESVDYLSFDLNCAIHPCCRNLSDESKEISHEINGDYRNLISGEITNFNSIEKLNFKSWDYLLLEKL